MDLPSKPFELAERYIQLRTKCAPESWADTAHLVSDMIIMPLILLFLAFVKGLDPMMTAMNGVKAYQAWREYIEYTHLRFEMQRMMLHCQAVGGPFIVTNDPKYMPYVFADAVQRWIAKAPPGGRLDG
uniref:Uncharacterized protein n=1 Tax=viral metagenome TaxID=1070528 RepID=A0A6C0F3G1_9ZZZZ